MKPNVSLIISFYNNIDLLSNIFAALEQQTYKDFEVIIADDGSREDVVEGIHRMIKTTSFPVQHCWHEDMGWQKNKILNQAIRHCKGDYLIFIDGDCIPHRCFIEEHVENKRSGTVLTGRRVQLTQKMSEELLKHGFTSKRFQQFLTFRLVLSSLFHKNIYPENAIRIKRPFLRKVLIKDKIKGIKGCNFSVHKEDLLLVNGFDERYLYPGTGEDTDLDRRLKRAGIVTYSKKHLLTIYHIYHKRFDLNHAPNIELLEENDRNGVTYTPYGIVKNA